MIDYAIYTKGQLGIASILLFIGLFLLLGYIPAKFKKGAYYVSRNFIAASAVVLALSIMAFFIIARNNIIDEYDSTSYSLGFNYIVSHLAIISFIRLLGEGEQNYLKPRYILGFLGWIVYTASVYYSSVVANTDTAILIQLLAAISLCCSIILQFTAVINKYNKYVKSSENYFSSNEEVHIAWMMKSIYHFIAAGVLSAIFSFSVYIPLWITLIYTIYVCCIFIYVFNCYIKYTTLGNEITKVSETNNPMLELETRKVTIPAHVFQKLDKQIEKWIKTKGYCKHGMTIYTAATEIGTNRLYLSNYINVTYKESFRVWISKLRIAESKRLLLKHRNVTITSISDMVGFVSIASFNHSFKALEGVSPKKWLENTRAEQETQQ